MFRHIAFVAALAVPLVGCATTPLAPLTAEQQKFHDQEVRLLFARLIANHTNLGARSLLFGPREYSNARISIPHDEKGRINLVCAKVYIKPLDLLGPREVDLSASVIESQSGVRLSMAKSPDIFGTLCKDSFTPFPELEALSAKSS